MHILSSNRRKLSKLLYHNMSLRRLPSQHGEISVMNCRCVYCRRYVTTCTLPRLLNQKLKLGTISDSCHDVLTYLHYNMQEQNTNYGDAQDRTTLNHRFQALSVPRGRHCPNVPTPRSSHINRTFILRKYN